MSADERIIYEYTRCREVVALDLYGSLESMYSTSLKVCAHVYPNSEIDIDAMYLRGQAERAKDDASAHMHARIHNEFQGRLTQRLECCELVKQALDRLQYDPLGADSGLRSNRLDGMTKMNYLRDELSKLISEESNARVILFTQHTETLAYLKRAVEALPGWQCLHFDKHTQPTKRHSIIKNFQSGKVLGAQAIIVTYGVAAGMPAHSNPNPQRDPPGS
jgi:SNF2 family DNA or RNA helicase